MPTTLEDTLTLPCWVEEVPEVLHYVELALPEEESFNVKDITDQVLLLLKDHPVMLPQDLQIRALEVDMTKYNPRPDTKRMYEVLITYSIHLNGEKMEYGIGLQFGDKDRAYSYINQAIAFNLFSRFVPNSRLETEEKEDSYERKILLDYNDKSYVIDEITIPKVKAIKPGELTGLDEDEQQKRRFDYHCSKIDAEIEFNRALVAHSNACEYVGQLKKATQIRISRISLE